MAESIVQVTEGSGKKLHTFQRTIGANNVEDEVMLLGEPYLAAYTGTDRGLAMPAANVYLLCINAGASLNVYVRRIHVFQWSLAAAATTMQMALNRITTAPTGTSKTLQPHDPSDAASGAVLKDVITVAPTDGVELFPRNMSVVSATPITPVNEVIWEFPQYGPKAIKIAAGTANGIGIKVLTIGSTANLAYSVTVVEANF